MNKDRKMELLNAWYSILDTKPDGIGRGVLKTFLDQFKPKHGSVPELMNDEESCDITIKICDRLIGLIKEGFTNLEGQTICSTCLCFMIDTLPNGYHIIYMKEVQDLLIQYLDINDDFETDSDDFSHLNTYKTIIRKRNILALINGLFQCDVIHNESLNDNPTINQLHVVSIGKSLEIIIRSCMKYSSNTFFGFKTLLAIVDKLCEWKINLKLFSGLHESILFVIFNNWENLYPGVKDINSKILRSYLKLVDNLSFELTHELMTKPWSKLKFHILCETIPHLKSVDGFSEELCELCVEGLMYSLRNASVMPVGKDFYKVILQTFANYEEWHLFFYDNFVQELCGDNRIVKANILNYWLAATLKKYPNLLRILLNDLENSPNDNSLLPFLFIAKLGRKGGKIMSDWDSDLGENVFIKKNVRLGLVHIHSHIRTQAFEILCCCSKNTIMPTVEEFTLVKEFLLQNVTEDSTVFRTNTLSSFILFIERLRDSLLYNTKHNSMRDLRSLESFDDFFLVLHSFLFKNLSRDGNYQRKITSLKLLEILLAHFSTHVETTYSIRKSNLKNQGWKISKYLRDRNKWFFDNDLAVKILLNCIVDPTNDVRELATKILMRYYIDHLELLEKKRHFFINAINLCNSKLFYEADSGKLLLKLLLNVRVLHSRDVPNLLCTDDTVQIAIMKYLIDKCWEHLLYHDKDSFYSICNNQTIYGMLEALNIYVKHCAEYVDSQTVINIILLLTETTTFGLRSFSLSCLHKGDDYSPSFAEMGESIKIIISSSNCRMPEDQNDVQTSNSQALVMNNIWLNLKSCGELASTLIESCHQLMKDSDIEKCVEINISILTKCRHKGAIESAGLYLGRAVNFLTSLDNEAYNELLSSILENFLSQVLSNDTKSASITRRSAGLTILVHRFVTSDSRSKKPLFFVVIIKLIKFLLAHLVQKNVKSLQSKDEYEDMDVSKNEAVVDLPHARAIHLLCRTISDSSLSQFVIQFASQLSTVCFEYICSDQWQMRNAALQLYGALVPKLVGRKGKDNNENISESSMTVDELFSHIPRLWKFIEITLQNSLEKDSREQQFAIQRNLVPLLNLLSNTARRSHFKFNLCNTHVCVPNVDDYFTNFMNLLESPLFAIRTSVAKIIELFYDIKTFHDGCMVNDTPLSMNRLHGYLFVMKNYLKHFNAVKKYSPQDYIENFIHHFESLLSFVKNSKFTNSSFVLNSLYLEILYNFDKHSLINYFSIMTRVFETYKNMNRSKQPCIGGHNWINLNLNMVVMDCSEDILVDVISFCSLNFDSAVMLEGLLQSINNRFKNKLPKDPVSSKSIINTLNQISENNSHISKVIFEIIYKLIEKAPIDTVISCDELFEKNYNLCRKIYMNFNCEYLIPFLSIILTRKCIFYTNLKIIEDTQEFMNIVREFLKSDKCDVEKKLEIIKGLKNLVKIVIHLCKKQLPEEREMFKLKTDIMSSIIWLLQDEDKDVRYETAKIIFFEENLITFPNNVLNSILTIRFLREVFGSDFNIIKFLQTVVEEVPTSEKKRYSFSFAIAENPFDHEVKNIYLEPLIIKESIFNIISSIQKNY